MRSLERAAIASLMAAAIACGDRKPDVADTSELPNNTVKASPSDTIAVDSALTPQDSVTPPPPTPSLPPSVTGEGRRDNPPASRDPMPPLTGETSKQGGTMPVYRDSASGPRMEIDSKGRVTPIKK